MSQYFFFDLKTLFILEYNNRWNISEDTYNDISIAFELRTGMKVKAVKWDDNDNDLTDVVVIVVL